MQSPRVRASSPRPLTRRSSRRDLPFKSASSFHLPPVSPTTPSSNLSPFTNAHSSVSSSLTALTTQSTTPPPSPAPSPTASRSARHASLRRRQSDLTRRSSDLTRRQSDLSRKQSDLTRKQPSITRRQSRRQSLCQSPDKSSITPPPASPRKVRFSGERVVRIAGDSSDEEDGFFPDSMLKSHTTATSSCAKDPEDSRRRTRENFGHDNPGGRIAESDNDLSRRGRRSSRGAPGKRSATPFFKRGSNREDEDEDEGGEDEAKDSRVTHGISAEHDGSTLKKRTSTIERDDKSTFRQGPSSSRRAPLKRDATPLIQKRNVSWEDEDEDEHYGEVNEKNGNVIVHASSQDRSNDDGAVRSVRSFEENDDEPGSSRRGRSSSRGSPAKRSATPFVRGSVNWEDEADEDDGEGVGRAIVDRIDSNAQFDLRERNAESDDESHERRGRSISENDDGPPSLSRGRSSSRGTRGKRSPTPFVRRNIYWADEDEDSLAENDAQSAKAKGKECSVVQTSHDMPFVRRTVNWEDEGVEKVARIDLEVRQEIDECVTIVEDEDEQIDGQQRSNVMRKNGADTNESRKDRHHQATISGNGDLQVTVLCSCGKAQILTYSSRTGIDIKPC